MVSTISDNGCHSSHLEDVQLLAHLEFCLCRCLLTMVRPSSLCPSVSFHNFNISMRILSIMAAILKVFSCYLFLNCKSDGAEAWWQTWGQHGDLELLKWFLSDIQDGHYDSHLENLQIISALER